MRLLARLLAATLALGPAPALADDVLVFAAASLRTALDRIAADYSQQSGDRVTISYAGSGQLARQIMAGAPAGLFISANPEWMDQVEDAGRIAPDSRRDLLGNTLVLIAHQQDASVTLGQTDLLARLDGGKLAMGLVEAVPAGQYGKAALEHLGLWDELAPHVAQADNVRAALALVATGAAPYGIVYATDAAAEPAVSIAARFPAESHPPITYPVALMSDAAPADRAFYDALFQDGARGRFAAAGFVPLD